jgi:DNA-binding Lrp family transcriptional regulator
VNRTTNSVDYPLTILDRHLINTLQKGLPICERPFAAIAQQLNSLEQDDSLEHIKSQTYSEQQVIDSLNNLLERGILTRFGPMFDAACLGGAFTLAAIDVPTDRFDEVTEIVNSFEQVAHNYERDHQLNMWFVVGTESQQEISQVITSIEQLSSLKVLNVPKLEEFYVGLYFPV